MVMAVFTSKPKKTARRVKTKDKQYFTSLDEIEKTTSLVL